MSVLLKPLVESEVTDYVTGEEGGNILSQRLGAGGGGERGLDRGH